MVIDAVQSASLRRAFITTPFLITICLGGLLGTSRAVAIEEVNANHILVRTKEEADKIRAEVVKGGGTRAAFSNACRKYSLDVYTKRQAGALGWFPRVGNMDPVFSEAAFGLQKNEISVPVQTPHGWHLIFVKDRRDRSLEKAKASTTTTTTPIPTPKTTDNSKKLVPETGHEGHNHPPGQHPTTTPTPTVVKPLVKAAPAVKASGTRRTLAPSRLVLSIESAQNMTFSEGSNTFSPDRAVELNLSVKNEGSTERKVPAASLLPLGFKLSQLVGGKEIAGDFSSIAKPGGGYFVSLKSYEMIGLEVSVNDFFKDVYATGRFQLNWDGPTFFSNLEKTFPDVAQSEGYAAIKADLNSSVAFTLDKIRRDASPHWRLNRNKPYSFSILSRLKKGDKLYARIKVSKEATPVIIELDTDKQFTAARHFVKLAAGGFYDMLNFYEVHQDDYVVGGCPLKRGTGAPSMQLPRARNDKHIAHTAGTVSFVSRHVRSQGPVRGGEIGSIFFVTLKDHPEWNDVHVPFGKVLEGLNVMQRVRRGTYIESITILPPSEYQPSGAAVAAVRASGRANPTVTIKTSKGELRLTLLEDSARETVANFVTLAEAGFYDKADDGGKQKFFNVMKDAKGGGLLIQAGSASNDSSGSKEFDIYDEVNKNRCQRGAVVMTKRWDGEKGSYVPNSASSQFFICLQDIPAYDYENAFTVFGKVDPASLALLDQLAQGDEITEVKIDTKRERKYSTYRKIQ